MHFCTEREGTRHFAVLTLSIRVQTLPQSEPHIKHAAWQDLADPVSTAAIMIPEQHPGMHMAGERDPGPAFGGLPSAFAGHSYGRLEKAANCRMQGGFAELRRGGLGGKKRG